jgi:hypothetical protein
MAITNQHDTYLSNNVSVSKYIELEKAQDIKQIVTFVRERFTERYITPLRGDPELKHGFCTIAICCLMIEALESFWRGWERSNNRSELAFCSFFDRNANLEIFRGFASDFYKNVRCGILHQAETTNGWRIRRDGPIFDSGTKTINATLFHNEMEKCLEYYCSVLEQSDWNSKVWKDFRKKMKAIIANCRSEQ